MCLTLLLLRTIYTQHTHTPKMFILCKKLTIGQSTFKYTVEQGKSEASKLESKYCIRNLDYNMCQRNYAGLISLQLCS